MFLVCFYFILLKIEKHKEENLMRCESVSIKTDKNRYILVKNFKEMINETYDEKLKELSNYLVKRTIKHNNKFLKYFTPREIIDVYNVQVTEHAKSVKNFKDDLNRKIKSINDSLEKKQIDLKCLINEHAKLKNTFLRENRKIARRLEKLEFEQPRRNLPLNEFIKDEKSHDNYF